MNADDSIHGCLLFRPLPAHIDEARACELLAGTDEPIAAVSASVGFSRQGSFSEAFKERFGVTPNRYRMLNQNR